jgi:hypothetical protein
MAFQLVRRHLLSYKKETTTFGMRLKWSFHDVVHDVHREEIGKLATKLSGAPPGHPDYLAHYKPAQKKIEEGLTEEMRVKYTADAKRWSETAPPASVKLRYVPMLWTLGND